MGADPVKLAASIRKIPLHCTRKKVFISVAMNRFRPIFMHAGEEIKASMQFSGHINCFNSGCLALGYDFLQSVKKPDIDAMGFDFTLKYHTGYHKTGCSLVRFHDFIAMVKNMFRLIERKLPLA